MEVALIDGMPDEQFESFVRKYAELFIKGGEVKSAAKTSDQINVSFKIGKKELFISMHLWDPPTGINESHSGTM